jgi:hypothetical protein
VWCGAVVSDNADGDDIGNIVTVRQSSMSGGDCCFIIVLTLVLVGLVMWQAGTC